MINDLYTDRVQTGPERTICVSQRVRLEPPSSPGRSVIIARLIHDLAAKGHRVLIT